MIAIWALVIAVFVLAAAVLAAAYVYVDRATPKGLTDEEIEQRLAPIAAELLVWVAEQHPDTPESELDER